MFVFFKQMTAYEMRISDWSSDVCSSDLLGLHRAAFERADRLADARQAFGVRVAQPGTRGQVLRFARHFEFVAVDERTMDDEIGVAADRRGEMRVGAERKAEMTRVDRKSTRLNSSP